MTSKKFDSGVIGKMSDVSIGFPKIYWIQNSLKSGFWQYCTINKILFDHIHIFQKLKIDK